ncbi:glycoside hydrolase family 53 protein [Opitutus terrae]|uniref:Arabinogalactan endo-beta-1,4-galactanase n=1 Tax=Opitutus terrae (strain DSM 11246 / JCM 15787 / PB90-1) TaxID=452637 RepID=B1ZNL3_OPITP|nr:glycosyl hydrolase 53 family protein [Opitutus terrae]ACB74447.1 Arabinogalactan endo-1,4-beta-galactosidase [Opitutus terrae PB90-1]
MRTALLTKTTLAVLGIELAGCATTRTTTTGTASATRPELSYAIGADVSFLRQAEARGVRFKDDGVAKPGLQIFRDHGYNWIRLRLFHTPSTQPRPLPNDLAYTISLAQDAKALGYKFLLDYHYSDTWADPQKQFPPKAWENLSTAELIQAVHDYTRDTIAALRDAGVMPDMVQIGNEITPGMLWPHGKLPENWDTFAALVKAGIRGVDSGRGDAPRPLIMIHIDQGGNRARTQAFFDPLLQRGVEFDVIGQSYYPWWHGSLLELRDCLAFTAERYRKDIILVEVAYNWRPAEYRDRPAPFPETPEGQREFLEEVQRAVLATPHGLGKGVFWWEPAVAGFLSRRGMFDDDGNALPVIRVFDKYTRGKVPQRQQP